MKTKLIYEIVVERNSPGEVGDSIQYHLNEEGLVGNVTIVVDEPVISWKVRQEAVE